ncbi:MAG TPA: hypothetical protein DCM31_00480 [Deferribacteraceae bacterium]|jgi:hypothetical protein|nr:hypothetical protein [Deferribacteraceae bacterium]
MKKLIILLISAFMCTAVYAQPVKVSAVGEADIMGGDTASARTIAIARAKWAALEEAAGVKVKSDTILQNAVLVDEAIKTEVQGVIKSFNVTGEEKDDSIYRVQISATVEKTKAESAVGIVSKNTTISVMLPVVFPNGKVEESSALSENVINELTSRNMEVVDMAGGNGFGVKELEKAMKSNDYLALRNAAFKNLSNTILIGKVETTATAQQGADIGYGVSLPFNVVTGRLTYRLITEKYGNRVILASGYIPVRGQGSTIEDATFRMTENLRDSVSATLVGIVMEKMQGANSRMVTVRLMGKTDMDRLMQLKQMLTYTSWVLEVKDQGVDSLVVTYPEKTLYLATSLNGRSGFKVEKFSDYEIIVSPQ